MISLFLGALVLLTGGHSVNFFSLKQDIEIGVESSKEAERSLPLVKNAALSQFVDSIGQRILQNRTLAPLKYRFQIVNSKEVNSLGFPGGPIYLYRGLLDTAANDDEVAAVIAHEIAHVAARHGTQQLSRQLLVQIPITIAAGVPVSEVWKEEITKLGISLGVDAPFLRYSRDQELDASLMAVRLMSEARFDPDAFRTLLVKINASQSSFLFNHPQAPDFTPEIAAEIDRLATPGYIPRSTVAFRTFHTTLEKTPFPIPVKVAATTATDAPEPLPNVFTHPMDYYRLGYPSNWQITPTGSDGAIIAPSDGVRSSPNGQDVVHGAMVDLFDISTPDRSLTLEQATNRLIVFLCERNRLSDDVSHRCPLRVVPGAQTQILVSDEPGLRTVMISKSEASNGSEVAWVVTRLYYQSLFYMIFVAPEDEFPAYQPVFEQIIRSARLR
jgi:Zn-dependent protease with chaperone function